MSTPMRIDVLISRLQQIQKEHGNIRVFVEGAPYIIGEETGSDIRPPFNTQDFEQHANHIAAAEYDGTGENEAYLII